VKERKVVSVLSQSDSNFEPAVRDHPGKQTKAVALYCIWNRISDSRFHVLPKPRSELFTFSHGGEIIIA
jgi:hypothetical protein